MRVAKGMRGDPRRTHAERRNMPLEELDQGCVAERLAALRATAADEEHDRRRRIMRPFVHDVAVDRLESGRLVKIDEALGT